MYPVSEDERRWQEESDARALARAEEIKADKERHARAVQRAGIMAKERVEEVKKDVSSLQAIANKQPVQPQQDGVYIQNLDRGFCQGVPQLQFNPRFTQGLK